MGEPVYVARLVAISLDMGNGIPSGTRLGVSPHAGQRIAALEAKLKEGVR
jgi:hypothetical protein